MANKFKTCSECGAKIIIYRHILNKGLVKGLIALQDSGGVCMFKDIKGVTFNQRNNFQKLQYWGLIRKGSGTYWHLTEDGFNFLKNNLSVPIRVHTKRNEVVGFDKERVTVLDALKEDSYWYRENYLENAVRG